MTSETPTIQLKECLSLLKDGTHNPPQRSTEGVKFIAGATDIKYLDIDFSKCSFVSQENYRMMHRKWEPEVNDVLLTIVGTVGNTAIVRKQDLPFTMQRSIATLRPNEKIDFRYLFYWLNSYEAEWAISSRITATGQPGIYLGELGKIPISLPRIDVQKNISEKLYQLDKLIRINKKLVDIIGDLVNALFRSWFVDFDPVKAKAEGKLPYGMDGETAALFPDSFEDSELGLIPIGWELSSVLDTANFINGAAYKSMHFCQPSDGLPVVKIAELKNGFTKQTQYTDSNLGDKYRLRIGDILFSWSGSPETSIDIFLWDKGDAWLNQHIFRVDSDSPISRTFNFALLKYLKTTLIWMATNRMTTGLGHVTKGDLQKLLFVDPPIKNKGKFHELIGPLLQEMENTKQNILLLSEIRDALLPRVISGELEVPMEA